MQACVAPRVQSLWHADLPPLPTFAPLQGDVKAEVLIIGGGITGLTLCLLLAERGRRVRLLEADRIGSGGTGRSTGNLYITLSEGLGRLHWNWGPVFTRELLRLRAQALDFIEAQCRHAPASQFRRCPLYLWAGDAAVQEHVDQEGRILQEAGFGAHGLRALPTLLGQALCLPGQAQLDPQQYLAHLAGRAAAAGALIHEHSGVLEIDGAQGRVLTACGSVQARELVMATHTPKGLRWAQAQMPVRRQYGIAMPLSRADPGPGIFWRKGRPGLSLRTVARQGQPWLICIGGQRPVGTPDSLAALQELEQLARQDLDAGEPVYRWSAQSYCSADGLPFIGRDASGCWLATGFAADGLTWGTVAARQLTGQLMGARRGVSAALGARCAPTRLNALQGGKALGQTTWLTVKTRTTDVLDRPLLQNAEQLAPGEGAIAQLDGQTCAAWRSPDGTLFAVSAICTHLGCRVRWNQAEASWDCPCHGSRFRPDGSVIEGPALAPLAQQQPRPDAQQ